MSTINLTGVKAAEENQGSSFKSVQPGVHTATISKLEMVKRGDKDVLNVAFSSEEAGAEFSHGFFLTEKALPSLQYLITKFTGNPLEGNVDVNALSAMLVGKTKTIVVDGQVRPREKDGVWYNNTYPRLRFAGFVEPEGADAEPRIDRSQEMDLNAVNGAGKAKESSSNDNSGLPF